jgi:phytanoyl-CoA hydroxylase
MMGELHSAAQRINSSHSSYLVIPDFFSDSETTDMVTRARQLLDGFDISGHPLTTFKTAEDGEHVGDDYFLDSGDKIRYFLETSALTPATATAPATLRVPPAQAVNKIGHALAVLDPVFRKYTLESDKVRDLARALGAQKSPRVLQSMIICKQPKIGGSGESSSRFLIARVRTDWQFPHTTIPPSSTPTHPARSAHG